MSELSERCCERPNLRTLFRGQAGCVEQCDRCGFAYGYDPNGELTDTTTEALAELHGSKDGPIRAHRHPPTKKKRVGL